MTYLKLINKMNGREGKEQIHLGKEMPWQTNRSQFSEETFYNLVKKLYAHVTCVWLEQFPHNHTNHTHHT